MTSTDRRQGVNASQAIKVACIAASTGNLTLSGEQTIDGIACVEDDRVFAKDDVEETARLIPDCTLEVYPGKGHLGVFRNRQLAPDILDFVRSRPAAAT